MTFTTTATVPRPVKLLLIALLFLAVFQFPAHFLRNGHDQGSQAAYEYWTLHGFAYGKDIVQNVGPLGFLNYPGIYTGFLDGTKLLGNLLLTGSFLVLLLRNAAAMPLPARVLLCVLTGMYLDQDAMVYLLLLFLAHTLLSFPRTRDAVVAALLLAVLSLAKGTGLFISLGTLVLFLTTGCISGRCRFSIAIVAWYAAGIAMLLAVTGQDLRNFPDFVGGLLTFSSGYNEAMTFAVKPWILAFGLATVLGTAFFLCWSTARHLAVVPRDRAELARLVSLALTEGCILFVAWKHGFVRADSQHYGTFFRYALASNLWLLFRATACGIPEMPWRRRFGTVLFVPVALAMVVAPYAGVFAVDDFDPLKVLGKMQRTFVGLVDIPGQFARLDALARPVIAQLRAPELTALPEGTAVGYFGIYPAIMVYNDFRYAPAPSTIAFAAWNAKTMAADQAFFRDPARAPALVLFDLDTIDQRLVAQDDALAQLELLHRYEVADAAAGNLLLRRLPEKADYARTVIGEAKAAVGDWLDVPQVAEPLWVRLDIQEGTLAKAAALAYKPPAYTMELRLADGRTAIHKCVPGMARVGFLLNPLVRDNQEAVAVRSQRDYRRYANGTDPILGKVVRLRVLGYGPEALRGQHVTVTFEAISGLILGQDADTDKLDRVRTKLRETRRPL